MYQVKLAGAMTKGLLTVTLVLGIVFLSPVSYAQQGVPGIFQTPDKPPIPTPFPGLFTPGQQQVPFMVPPVGPVEEIPAEIEEQPSAFEEYIRGESPLTISTDLQQFGYELFRQPPSTFAPVEIVPVGPDYLLGPGDEIRITLWGKVNAELPAIIDRDGKISLPQIGILHLSGLTFSEAKAFLEKEFSRYYKPSEVKMNVSMGRLRSIRVFVVGMAQRPGSYTLSSLSTLVNGLFAASGPSKIGTMRNIQVKRNGETVVHFDLYDFLLKGSKTRDIRLMPEDVIFIPPVGPLIGIAGNVKNPAIYELKGETQLLDLIDMAGGLTALAFSGRIQVQRIEDHQSRIIFEGDLINIEENPEKNFILKDGDLVKIFSVIGTTQWKRYRTAHIIGEAKFPGEYTIEKGETLSSLIERAGGFTDKAYLKGAVFTRRSVRGLQQIQLNESIDRLEQQMLSRSAVTIEAALSPGAAQQERAAAEQRRLLIAKMKAAKAKGRITIKLDTLERFKGSPYDIFLEDGDTLVIPEQPSHVQVVGSVYSPTAFIYDSQETMSNYLKKAGGMTSDADVNALYILKVDGTAISKREKGGFLGFGGLQSLKLDPGDTIVIPEKIERIAWLREIKDITQILFQIATTVGVVLILF